MKEAGRSRGDWIITFTPCVTQETESPLQPASWIHFSVILLIWVMFYSCIFWTSVASNDVLAEFHATLPLATQGNE